MTQTIRFSLFVMLSLMMTAALDAAPKKKTKPIDLKGATWIWDAGNANQARCVKAFKVTGKVASAKIIGTCDNHMTVHVNGKKVLASSEWGSPVQADVAKHLKAGENIVEAMCRNDPNSPAGFILKLQVIGENGKTQTIVSDKTWASHAKAAGKAGAVKTLGAYGVQPWGAVTGGGTAFVAAADNGPSVADGFELELIYTVPKGQQGSWVALTVLPDGRLIASDQGGKGLYTIAVPKAGSDDEPKVEKIPANISNGQGMVWAFDRLYVNRNGGGLWQVTDSTGDGKLDKAEELIKLNGGGEHGPHGVIVTESGKDLYFVGGNHTNIPPDLTGSTVPRVWKEDLLLPRQWDARGHARGKLAPGGWVARVSPDGKQRSLISIGYRNQYDVALNKHGEMFTFDSDMEWDFGMPWYRPTRVNHVVSGSEFGWRSGSGKWPDYYEDSLPAVVDIGPASPTGVASGLGSNFPGKWQDAIYILDWTYGTIWAVHLIPDGASYKAEVEEFVSGQPLPVTDAIVGKDGHFYFTVGGRGTKSALYRVRFTGDRNAVPSIRGDSDGIHKAARDLRRSLEAFHGKQDPKAVDYAWPHLKSKDRYIRYAARVAIESQPVKQWQNDVLDETDPQRIIQGIIALARHGDKSLQFEMLDKLYRLDFAKLSAEHKLGVLRAYALTFARMGEPERRFTDTIANKLDASYPDPGKDDRVNAELARVLVYLKSPTIVTKTMKLMTDAKPTPKPDWVTVLGRNSRYGGAAQRMLANMPPLQNLHYAFVLRNVRYGWTLEQRRQYFQFLIDASKFSGGASYGGFINNIRKEALANCSNAERVALKDLTGEKVTGNTLPDIDDLPTPKGPGRIWKVSDLEKLTKNGLRGRNYENGKQMYFASRCVLCHRFDGEGGAVGPDLTGVASRFSYKDLIDSIIDPSNVISDQYVSTRIDTKDGDVIVGRIVSSDGNEIKVMVDAYKPDQLTTVKKADIDTQKASKVSIMPANLIDTMNRDEALDLLAYIMSRGDKNDRVFK